ncbi:RNA recognition motif-containing protein, partial [Nowakowskiella sp. JEL0078]
MGEKTKETRIKKRKQNLESKEEDLVELKDSDTIETEVVSEETTPSKKKQKNDGETHLKSTLFVRGLPYTATNDELESYFSEIGPVKRSFVVANSSDKPENTDEKSTGPRNKGIGFVQFALAEDAASAITKLKGKTFQNKVLKLEFALKKSYSVDMDQAGRKNLFRSPKISDAILNPPKPSRRIVISDLPVTLAIKELNHKVRKFGKILDITFPMNSVATDSDNIAAIIKYETNHEAEEAVKHLNDHIYKGSKIKASIYTEKSDFSKIIAKKPKLIIRNLALTITSDKLKEIFSKFGDVIECTIPTKPGREGTTIIRGFGFIHFKNVEDAKKAMDKINGTKIFGRLVAVDWALPKDQYDQIAIEEDSNNAQDNTFKESEDQESESNEGEDDDINQFMDMDVQEEVQTDDDDDENDDKDEDNVDIVYETETKATEPKKPSYLSASVNEGSTLFIRNLSFESTEEDLFEKFKPFGRLRFARVVRDNLGKSRGTGFVCFHEKESADQCLSQYNAATAVIDTMQLSSEGSKFANKSSILVPEPSATNTLTQKFTLDTRFLTLALAVERETAQKLTVDRASQRRKEDKRNLYLMREGVIFPDTPAAQHIPPSEMSRRMKSFSERKRVLSTNTNLKVSKTRLSIRNLDLKVEDGGLKSAARRAVDSFWAEVKEGKRKGFEKEVLDEMLENGWKLVNNQMVRNRKPKITSAKVRKDLNRIDKTTGKARSLGYGFIEFQDHADSLACLRWMNNNPDSFIDPSQINPSSSASKPKKDKSNQTIEAPQEVERKKKSPIVEFAIDNMVVIKRLKERVEKQKSSQDANKKITENEIKKLDPKKRKRDSKEEETLQPENKSFKSPQKKIRNDRTQSETPKKSPMRSPKTPTRPIKSEAKLQSAKSAKSEQKHFDSPKSVKRTPSKREQNDRKDQLQFDEMVHKYKKDFLGSGTTSPGLGEFSK